MGARKQGQPTKYKPEYCQMLKDHMGSGLSYISFAAVIKVNVDTLYEWEKDQPIFSETKKEAFNLNRLFWEKAGVDGLWDQKEYDEKGRVSSQKSINSTLYIFNMKNRFPKEWRDRTEVKKETEHSVEKETSAEIIELMKELIALKKE